MAATYVNFAFEQITVDQTANIPIPTGASSGDILLIKFTGSGHVITSAPAGSTKIGSTLTQTNVTQNVYWVEYTGSSISYTIDVLGTPNANIEVTAYTGVDTTSPIDGAQQDTSQGTQTTNHPNIPSITPTVNGCAIAFLMSGEPLGANTGTTSAPFTERNDTEYWGLCYTATYDQTTAAQVTPTLTTTQSQYGAYTVVALAPPVSGDYGKIIDFENRQFIKVIG